MAHPEDGRVEIGEVLLAPGQFDIRIKMPDGAAAQAFDAGRGIVALDVTVTDESQAEGWARDLVRLIQNARKDANFQLTDRIAVALQVHGALKAAIVKHGETIKRDTLALHLDVDAELPKDAEGVASDTLDGADLRQTVAPIDMAS